MASVVRGTTSTFPEDWNADVPPGQPLTFDRIHFPFPVSPLFASTMGPAFAAGATAAFRALAVPMLDIVVAERNHYLFYRCATREPTTRSEDQEAEASLKHEIGRMMERWQGEHLPRILDHLRRLEDLDIAMATPADIGHQLEVAQAIHEDLWRIHFTVVEPAMCSLEQFDELYTDLFGEGSSEGHDLLVGGLSETLKAGIGLSDLAARARELGLADVLLETAPEALVGALEASDAGREFLRSLRAWLDAHGLRQNLIEYATPTWREDPLFAFASIRNYLQTGLDARAEQLATARSAEINLNAVRERLAAYPEPVRSRFESMVRLGRDGSFLHEEHNYYIDQRGMALLRLFYLKVGQRFVDAGSLDAPDDVFMLDIDAIRQALPGLADGGGSLRRLVTARRAEMAVAATLNPPPAVGGNPTGGVAEHGSGMPDASTPAADSAELCGMPGSRGKATGVARVARTLDDAGSLQPGEILVAISTLPPWTPLFGVVAALVTETGGPLCHSAIAAREYGIPAVVGVTAATTRIATGQRITVDGTSGTVTIHDQD